MSLNIEYWGCLDYEIALKKMRHYHSALIKGEIQNTLLVLEHSPVITRGRKIADQPLPYSALLAEKGIQVCNADRGGELTYHGPGQIVVYFVLKLADFSKGISEFVRTIELGLIDFLKEYNLQGHIDPHHPGLWVGTQKVASIGLRVSEGVTLHGLSLNIQNDLSVYQWFQPCGMEGSVMTSMAKLLQTSFNQNIYQGMQKRLAQILVQHLTL